MYLLTAYNKAYEVVAVIYYLHLTDEETEALICLMSSIWKIEVEFD
jgi:hypothetical protein